MDPASVMGMGGRKNGVSDSLDESALLQFQELTGLGVGTDSLI